MNRHALISGLGIGQICSWGSLYYSFPLIAEGMQADLGWTKPQLFGAATVGLFLAALLSYPVGRAIDRGHGRRIMVGGSLIAGLLLIGWSQVTTLPFFYLMAAGIGGLQAATLYEPAFTVVAWRMGPANARRDITALTLWGGFASTVFIPLTQLMLDGWGWRGTLLGLAAVNLVICTAVYGLSIGGPQAGHAVTVAPTAASESAKHGAVQAAMRLPVFWAFAVALVAYSGVFSAFTFHLYPMLIERGFRAADVVTAMAVIGPAQVAGRIAVGVFAKEYSVRTLGAVVVAFFPLAIGVLVFAPTTLAVAVGVAAVYGAANGIFTIVRGLAVPEMISRTNYGAINGALTAPATFARAVAPMGAAMLWSAFGGYGGVLICVLLGGVVFMVSFWLAAALPKPLEPSIAQG